MDYDRKGFHRISYPCRTVSGRDVAQGDLYAGKRRLQELHLPPICEKYGYNIPKANEQVLNRYIKDILKDLSEQLPSLKEKVPTKLTMKQKEALRKEKKEPVTGLPLCLDKETDLNGNVIVPRYDCVTSHTARRTGITNMYLSHKYTILQMMHVSGHKTQKTFMDYIKLSSEEVADEIAAMSKKENDMW